MTRLALSLALAASLPASPAGARGAGWEEAPGLYAVLQTGKGRIVCRLFEDKAPFTVDNFVGLATGAKMFIDPRDGKAKKGRYYDGTRFPRVIPGFMIQGGDPTNTTSGGPGFRFDDEFHPELKFDRPGLLAMANSGPGTNGSQFFITDRPRGGYDRLPSHLDGRHAIFGEVVEGLEVVSAIADTGVQPGKEIDKAVVLETVRIVRVEPEKKRDE